MHFIHGKKNFSSPTGRNKYLFVNTCYSLSRKDVISWKLRPKNSCLYFTNMLLAVTFLAKIIKKRVDVLYHFISFQFISFQIAPLIVIVSTASIGAIAFGVRQATKNPEAWYVSTVLIKPEKNVNVENKTSVLCYKTETFSFEFLRMKLPRTRWNASFQKAFVLNIFCFIFPCLVYKM